MNLKLTIGKLRDAWRDYRRPVMSQPNEIAVDCFGQSHNRDIAVTVEGRTWRFFYDESAKLGRRFVCGLYLDRVLLHPRALYRHPRSRRVFVLVESPQEGQFEQALRLEGQASLILTHYAPLLARGCPYERLDYGVSWVNCGVPLDDPRKNKLVSFIGNIQHPDRKTYYALRKRVAQELLTNSTVDCFGKGIRYIRGKQEALEPYCFSIAMENTQQDYYYTEKLIDCFLTQTIPVYWGCPSIGELFDVRGMIRFDTLEQLRDIIKSLNRARYEAMFPFVRENARRAVDGRLTSYEGLYTRIAERITAMANEPRITPWRRSKPLAAVRKLRHDCGRLFGRQI